MRTKPHVFRTFPEFSKLTLADREKYESVIQDFPPIDDIAFANIMTWWSPLSKISISQLNGNLVIPYWIPGGEKYSGLSLIGAHKIDESICVIFDYLREKGKPVRLVNVPEFVLSSVEYHDMFIFKHQRRFDEYIVATSQYYPLKNMKPYWRRKADKMLARIGKENIAIRSLDLQKLENKQLLTEMARKWRPRGINDFGKYEEDALEECVAHAVTLGVDNVCIFVYGRLYGFCLYEKPRDKSYVNFRHIKATQRSALGFELIGYLLAEWFIERGIRYVNINSDFGVLRLRMFMLTLGSVNFFRKYTVRPK